MKKHDQMFTLTGRASPSVLSRCASAWVLSSMVACAEAPNTVATGVHPVEGEKTDAAEENPEAPEDADPSDPKDDPDSKPSDGSDDDVRADAGANQGGRDSGLPDAGKGPNPGNGTQEERSKGCGVKSSGSGKFVTRTIEVGGMERTYHVRVPANYDPNRAYDLVTRWHGSGGDGLSGGLDIEDASGNDAIVVGADGLNNRWSNRENDLALFDGIMAEIGGEYCLNLDRVFAYGFSAGAGFTNLLSCVRGEVIRGVAVIAGYTSGSESACKGQVAAWFLHDENDDAVPIARGIPARDRLLAENGCSTTTVDVGDGCKEYQGCAEGYPVVWCQTSGLGHSIRGDYAPAKAWEFFSGL